MFKKSISSTPLTSDVANLCFQNITGSSYSGDNSFLASIRALVAPRLPEGDTISLRFGRSSYSAAQVAENSFTTMVEAICGSLLYNEVGQVYIHNFGGREEADNVANLELLKNKFTDVYNGWEQLEKVSNFYHKSFRCLCFINREMKSVALFVDQLNLQKLHYLQISILAFLPWYFDPAKGLTADELALVESLRKRDSSDYEACLARIASQYDFESTRIKQLLAGFETKFEQAECTKVRRTIDRIDSDLENLARQFADYNRQRNDACIRLLGLQQKIAEGGESSEIMDYFLCNRKLLLEQVDGMSILFIARDYLTYFDEDMAKRYINNNRSYFYDGLPYGGITKEQMKKLMWAIFVDQTLRMKVCAAYKFELNGRVNSQRDYGFDERCADYMPNPHIYYHACMGNYEGKVDQLLAKGDYISAIEQCIASAKSLNFGDSTVMNKFVGVITGERRLNNHCIELPDGTVVTPVEAIKWLEEQERKNTATSPVVETVVDDTCDPF